MEKAFEILRDFEKLGYSKELLNKDYGVFINLAKVFNPKSLLEIGVHFGCGACAFVYGAENLERYVGLDFQVYEKDSNQKARQNVKEFLEKNGRKVDVSILDWDTQKNGNKILNGEKFDWVHIDGGHEVEEVKKDMISFWENTGRIMTIHDVISHPPVKKGVDEIIDTMPDIYGHFTVISLHGFEVLIKKEK